MSIKNSAVLFGLILLLTSIALADEVGYTISEMKKFHQAIPDLPLDQAQKEMLLSGKSVGVLIPTEGSLKAGYMRVIVPFDPVTIWWITQDIGHFHLEDPAHPKTGSMLHKHNSMMPYVFDGAVCESVGRNHLYQLLVAPFVKPRKYSLRRYPDRSAFPWESAWEANEKLLCSENRDSKLEDFFKEAVHITHNNGCWRLGPVPTEYRNSPEDIKKTYIRYFVDTNPGGNIAAMSAIANKATSVAMPALHQNLMFLGKNWDEHLKKYHTPQEIELYHQEVKQFHEAISLQVTKDGD